MKLFQVTMYVFDSDSSTLNVDDLLTGQIKPEHVEVREITNGSFTREQFKRARGFAKYHGRDIEDWMLWDGWQWIGCENCGVGGPEASCWGKACCHGYFNGCGCRDCVEEDKEAAHSLGKAII